MSGNQNINSPVGNKSMLCSSRLCVSVILSGPSCHHAVCPQAFHRYVSFDQQSTLLQLAKPPVKKTKQFHIQQCLLRYPRSQSKRSILVLPLQTKMDIQESFAKTMICTQANTGAHHMVCGSTQAKKTVYTRLCFSPFFCQTWRRLFGTLLAPSFCNASAIDYILSQMPVCNPQVQNHKPNTKSASLSFLGPFPFPCCCFFVPPPCHSFGKLM